MSLMASEITGVSIVYPTVCSGADQRKHQSYASMAFVRGIHRWQVNSLHKGPVTRKMFPFDDGHNVKEIALNVKHHDMLSDYVVYGGYRVWLGNDVIKDVWLD